MCMVWDGHSACSVKARDKCIMPLWQAVKWWHSSIWHFQFIRLCCPGGFTPRWMFRACCYGNGAGMAGSCSTRRQRTDEEETYMMMFPEVRGQESSGWFSSRDSGSHLTSSNQIKCIHMVSRCYCEYSEMRNATCELGMWCQLDSEPLTVASEHKKKRQTFGYKHPCFKWV